MNGSELLKVMVVDDTETNVDILLETLGDDYDVRVAMDGKAALEDIFDDPPDIILLDIMMPEMDGYEVCERLKADESTKDIPIVFLTAMSKEQDESKGLAMGAVDYVTKPFSPELVKARVRNHLELKKSRDELKKQNEVLLENAQLREDIERISRHDLKTPLNSIINFPKLMKKDNLTEEQREKLKKISSTGYKMLNMINLSLDMYKMEQGTYRFTPTPVDLISVVNDIVEENSMLTMLRGVSVEILVNGAPAGNEDPFLVNGEKLLLYSMLANTVKNAIEASPDDEQIAIELNQEDKANISIHNKGAVPEEIRDRFFEKYVTAGKGGGTGLGTYSAWLIAEKHGGTVNLDSSEESGTTITFSFPKELL